MKMESLLNKKAFVVTVKGSTEITYRQAIGPSPIE